MPDLTASTAHTESDDRPGRPAAGRHALPREAMHGQHLHQLLRAALPDSSHHKAAGWFGQTDFLFTRRHVDEDQDAYHDGLFITLWKRWDFWLALPDDSTGPGGRLAQAWARLPARTPSSRACRRPAAPVPRL